MTVLQLNLGDYWELIDSNDAFAELVHPDGFYRAIVKWDGCVHFYKAENGANLKEGDWQDEDFMERESTYIHYCDLDEEIKTLMTLRNIQKLLFPDS